MLFKLQSKAGKSGKPKMRSCFCPLGPGFSHVQTEFKHNGFSDWKAAHIQLCHFNSCCPCNLILMNCTYHVSLYIHEPVMLPDSKARTAIYKFPQGVSSSKMNRCPGQERGRIKGFSWGRHLPCLHLFYPSDHDHKASETQLQHRYGKLKYKHNFWSLTKWRWLNCWHIKDIHKRKEKTNKPTHPRIVKVFLLCIWKQSHAM